MAVAWHRRLAQRLGYDIEKFNKQVTVETHLRSLLPRLGIDLVLDVGANTGQHATLLRRIGYRGDIISFEPAAAAHQALSRTAAGDPRWHVEQLGLGAAPATAELHVAGASVFNSLHTHSAAGLEAFGGSLASSATEQVQVLRLDDYLGRRVPDFASRRVFLKMDTQGHDRHVFEGAGDYRGRFAGLQSEISVIPIYEDVPDYLDMLTLYRGFGYEVTGLYAIHRQRDSSHVIEFDCVMAPRRG